jgi:hypothetical protein
MEARQFVEFAGDSGLMMLGWQLSTRKFSHRTGHTTSLKDLLRKLVSSLGVFSSQKFSPPKHRIESCGTCMEY